MKKTALKLALLLLFIISADLSFTTSLYAEEVYYPYPIIFVHGLNSSDSIWMSTRDELRRYFRAESGECKYPDQDSEKNYFVGCDYKDKNNGDIVDVAKKELKTSIDNAFSYYPSSIPESERKVNIVCHSMGGLVVRYLLTDIPSYKDKINRVVFIDTPHLGSPYASVLWLFNEIKNGAGEFNITRKKTMYNSLSAFSPYSFNWPEYMDYASIGAKMTGTYANIWALLEGLEITGPKPSKEAIRDLRTPAFTSYDASYSGFLSGLTVKVHKDYPASDTFLGKYSLALPSDYRVIRGSNPFGAEVSLWAVNNISKLDSGFTFSTLSGETQSISNAIFAGDGIVTRSSQEGIREADYAISSFHIGAADNAYNAILQSLEDKPEIVSVYIASEQEGDAFQYYLFVKVKDYLLADIEISEMTINGSPVDLAEFYDSQTGAYKPYVKYGKDFLKARDGLKTGEFKVRINSISGRSEIYVKLKNPAGKESDRRINVLYNDILRDIIGGIGGQVFTQSNYSAWSIGRAHLPGVWSITHEAAWDNYLAEDEIYVRNVQSNDNAYVGTMTGGGAIHNVGYIAQYSGLRTYLRFDLSGYSATSSARLHLKVMSTSIAAPFKVEVYRSNITSGTRWSIDWWGAGCSEGYLIGEDSTSAISDGYLTISLSSNLMNNIGYLYVEIKSSSEDTYDPIALENFYPTTEIFKRWNNFIRLSPADCYLQVEGI